MAGAKLRTVFKPFSCKDCESYFKRGAFARLEFLYSPPTWNLIKQLVLIVPLTIQS